MDNSPKHTGQTVAYILISVVLGSYLLDSLSYMLIPITWSIFLSFALLPLCTWLEDRRIPRVLAILISIVAITLVAGTVVYVMLHQTMALLEDAPEVGEKLDNYFSQLKNTVMRIFRLPADDKPWDPFSVINGEQVNVMLRTTVQTMTNIAIIPIFTFFFIYYKDFFNAFVIRLQLKNNAEFTGWTGEISKVIQGYLTGMLIVTAVVSTMASFIFYMLGIKYFLLFALFIAVFNLIPYVGVILSSVVMVVYVFLTTDSILYPALTLFFLWLIQLIENNLITPVLVGNRIQLNPLSVIIAIMIGGSLWGVSGMVLFIPLVGVLKILFDKTERLRPYGYLLGADVPITERRENFFKILRRKWRRHPNGSG